jgi:hypothetical protein
MIKRAKGAGARDALAKFKLGNAMTGMTAPPSVNPGAASAASGVAPPAATAAPAPPAAPVAAGAHKAKVLG